MATLATLRPTLSRLVLGCVGEFLVILLTPSQQAHPVLVDLRAHGLGQSRKLSREFVLLKLR